MYIQFIQMFKRRYVNKVNSLTFNETFLCKIILKDLNALIALFLIYFKYYDNQSLIRKRAIHFNKLHEIILGKVKKSFIKANAFL